MDRETLASLIPLLPMPRELESLGGQSTALDAEPTITHDPVALTKPAEYVLEIGRGLSITAGDQEGVRCALATLEQIRSLGLDAVPAIRIHDWASFATRGFMLDVSRDRIPTMDEMHRLIRLLASLKFNHFQLYFEHTFAYAGHEGVWQDLDPITPEQYHELDEACRKNGIELVAQQNCFGHLAKWLVRDRYAPLAETHGPYLFNGIPRTGPMSLCPNDPRSLELVSDWIAQLRHVSSSGLLHIGCDETADVGSGRSATSVERLGLPAVYARYVSSIVRICEERGFQPMFWADIALSEPATLEMLPKTMLAMAWGYEPDTPFAGWVRTLGDAGFESWVCPGTSCWRSFTGRTMERQANMASAAIEGAEAGATGFLLTEWGDLGHRQQWPIMLRALGDGAQAAWSGTSASRDAIAVHIFGQRDSHLVHWLDQLGDADLPLRMANPDAGRQVLRNATAIFDELHPANPDRPPRGSLDEWLGIEQTLDQLRRTMPRIENDAYHEEIVHTLQRAELAVRIALLRRGADLSAEAIADDVRTMMDDHLRLWLRRSRSAGLASSLSYDQSVLESLTSP
ncbi:MAG TPA: hypothetical protein ENJ00_12285 [Phycisphaerales bacterium]|nr:hypothetical protein [Phycisphaerales bacterium]